MEVYFFMLAIPSALAVSYGGRKNSVVTIIVFSIFVFLMGFRFNVGMDWNNYEDIHRYIGRESLTDILLGAEPLSALIFWISTNIGSGSLLSNVVASATLMLGVLSFARRMPLPWVAVAAATPFLIIAFGMSGIRQAMAAGILLYAMSAWDDRGTVQRCLFVLLASLFHTSAVMAILFVLWDLRLRLAHKVAVTTLAAPILFFVYQQFDPYSESIQFYQENYLSGPGAVISPGALYHIALVGIPAGIYFAFRKKFAGSMANAQLVYMGAWAVIAVFLLYFLSSTGASRLSAYLYFVPMAVYSSLPSVFSKNDRLFLVVGVVTVHFVILAAWLVYANNSFAHIPYRNVLFESSVSIIK
jgi:hypothetical protein